MTDTTWEISVTCLDLGETQSLSHCLAVAANERRCKWQSACTVAHSTYCNMFAVLLCFILAVWYFKISLGSCDAFVHILKGSIVVTWAVVCWLKWWNSEGYDWTQTATKTYLQTGKYEPCGYFWMLSKSVTEVAHNMLCCDVVADNETYDSSVHNL